MTASSVLSRSENDSYLRRPAIAAPVLLIAQVALGIGAYLARVKSAGAVQPLEPLISLTAGHVVVGALTLANMIVLMLRCHRVLVSEGERTGEMTSSAGIGSRAAV
jgi:heme A synthase